MKKHPFFYRKGRFLMKCKDSRTIYHRWTWTVQGSDRTKYRDATNSLTPRDSDFMPIKYILRKSCDLMTESKMTIGKFRGNLYRNVHNSLKLNTVTAMAKGVVSDPKFTNYPSPSNPVSNFHPFLLGHHPHTPPPPLLALNVRLGASQVHNKSKLVQGDLTFSSITLSNEIKMMRCDSDFGKNQTPEELMQMKLSFVYTRV